MGQCINLQAGGAMNDLGDQGRGATVVDPCVAWSTNKWLFQDIAAAVPGMGHADLAVGRIGIGHVLVLFQTG